MTRHCLAACQIFFGLTALAAPARTAEPDPEYLRVTNERAAKIVSALGLADADHAQRVTNLIAQQYRDLSALHDARDVALKATPKLEEREAAALRAEADGKVIALHRRFVARLAAELTPDQVDKVKDGLTYGVGPITYAAYQKLLPDLTDDQRREILAQLLEAREYAMDAGSSEEKHAWFGKYKGRITNYLSKAGYDLKAAENERSARRQLAPVNPRSAPPADQPVERTDLNSRLAHQQLLAKAKQGRIDVYFLGDSITRRWGATDPQYAPMLANWKKNFFGYNAANFGWGGDATQNILWRLNNGELDGVNPKVIVILAGTNNVGSNPPSDADAKATDVARGVKTILDVCRQRAPDAVIVLTAIFPRNDNPAVMPTIDKINAQLARYADGKQIRVLNINAQLADPNGKLHAGMTPDGLHPSVQAYQLWADALKPIFTELLGPPAKEDHAPPPTGDPSASQ